MVEISRVIHPKTTLTQHLSCPQLMWDLPSCFRASITTNLHKPSHQFHIRFQTSFKIILPQQTSTSTPTLAIDFSVTGAHLTHPLNVWESGLPPNGQRPQQGRLPAWSPFLDMLWMRGESGNPSLWMLLDTIIYQLEIGFGLTGFGVFFWFLGIILFFDKGLLAIGNILFISGVITTIGIKSSLQFFTKRDNFKGTVSFGTGFLLVIIGWPVIGMAAEAYGVIILFSGFWPILSAFMQKIPVIGWLFQQSWFNQQQ